MAGASGEKNSVVGGLEKDDDAESDDVRRIISNRRGLLLEMQVGERAIGWTLSDRA